MEDLSFYFQPNNSANSISGIGNVLQANDEHGFPDLDKKGVAIFRVPEYRNSDLKPDNNAGENIVAQFASLHTGDGWDFSIYDLGAVIPGESFQDTSFAVAKIVEFLVKKEIIPVILGGSQDLILSIYQGYERLEQTVNICSVDKALDVGDPESPLKSDAYVSHILMQRPCYLFNYASIGLQRPHVSKDEMELFDKLYFDVCRLGAFNDNFRKAEPHLRNSDIINIDVEAIKGADIDPATYSRPNGFRSDQICQIAKYAGLSDKLSSFALFNIHADQSRYADQLLAEVIWYFIDGYSQRMGDFPVGSKRNYKRFFVHLDDFEDDLTFYKSDRSGRWWLEVKYPSGKDKMYERHHLVPCDHEDYTGAMENRIPDLWWKTLQKLTS